MIRMTIDKNHLPTEVDSSVGDGHAQEEFPSVHILNRESILPDSEQDASRLPCSRQPLPGKLVAGEPLELMNAKILANRLLKAHNVNLFLPQVLSELPTPASEAKAPNVPI